MNKLKTLKDLRATEWNRTEDKKGEDWVKVEELRQETIEWIKNDSAFDKLIEKYMKFKETYDLTREDLGDFACNVLMHIHNITERDLK